MLKKVMIALAALVVIAAAVVVVGVLRPPQAASGPIEAIPIATSTPQADQSAGAAVATQPARAADAAPATQPVIAAGATTYTILQNGSQASFTIHEILRGSPNTVVGTTNQVAGEIGLNMADPAKAQVGTIQVDARTLATDNDFRNRTIKNAILQTNSYEYITFTPTNLRGLPDSVGLGQAYSFQIVGDLTITGVTKQVTFDASVTPVLATRLEGKATAIIQYADFGISIPQVPSVAGVEPNVVLEIDFVAVAAQGG
jgi:polyisoprenoid-binding protein YceI